jgi:hypothetical protein
VFEVPAPPPARGQERKAGEVYLLVRWYERVGDEAGQSLHVKPVRADMYEGSPQCVRLRFVKARGPAAAAEGAQGRRGGRQRAPSQRVTHAMVTEVGCG